MRRSGTRSRRRSAGRGRPASCRTLRGSSGGTAPRTSARSNDASIRVVLVAALPASRWVQRGPRRPRGQRRRRARGTAPPSSQAHRPDRWHEGQRRRSACCASSAGGSTSQIPASGSVQRCSMPRAAARARIPTCRVEPVHGRRGGEQQQRLAEGIELELVSDPVAHDVGPAWVAGQIERLGAGHSRSVRRGTPAQVDDRRSRAARRPSARRHRASPRRLAATAPARPM